MDLPGVIRHCRPLLPGIFDPLRLGMEQMVKLHLELSAYKNNGN